MPLKAALPENKDVLLGAHRLFGEGALVEPDRNRTYRPPDESGAPPLSYGPVTKDARTMPECGFAANQENGLPNMTGLVEPIRLRSRLLISTTSIRSAQSAATFNMDDERRPFDELPRGWVFIGSSL